MSYFVYILASRKHGALYIGVTNNLARRIQEHKDEVVPGFTREYHIHQLVYYESYDNAEDAIRREKNMKAWRRQWKERIIEELNQNWQDLSAQLLE